MLAAPADQRLVGTALLDRKEMKNLQLIAVKHSPVSLHPCSLIIFFHT